MAGLEKTYVKVSEVKAKGDPKGSATSVSSRLLVEQLAYDSTCWETRKA